MTTQILMNLLGHVVFKAGGEVRITLDDMKRMGAAGQHDVKVTEDGDTLVIRTVLAEEDDEEDA